MSSSLFASECNIFWGILTPFMDRHSLCIISLVLSMIATVLLLPSSVSTYSAQVPHAAATCARVSVASGGSAPIRSEDSPLISNRRNDVNFRSFDGEVLANGAVFPAPYAQEEETEPFEGLMRARGWHWYNKSEVLQCLAAVGGVCFAGDSTVREMASELSTFLGRSKIQVQNVKWPDQRADETFDAVDIAPSTKGGAWRRGLVPRFRFRFAQNAWPDLGARVEECSLPPRGFRVVVAHSALWDVMPDSGTSETNWLSSYMKRISYFFRFFVDTLLPRLEQSDEAEAAEAAAAGRPADPPRRWIWRAANPTHRKTLDKMRLRRITWEHVSLLNAFAREVLDAIGGWQWLDTQELQQPSRLPQFLDEDGYHPSHPSSLTAIQSLMNRLCSPAITMETLLGIVSENSR
jgi:hypothetical protein